MAKSKFEKHYVAAAAKGRTARMSMKIDMRHVPKEVCERLGISREWCAARCAKRATELESVTFSLGSKHAPSGEAVQRVISDASGRRRGATGDVR